ncbi:MAG: PaaI family thioesterase [Sphingomonadaceae bacterium]|nr:PaaI family thioesterase [Sphingomonadaceae bacterium]
MSSPGFICEADPDNPGWLRWEICDHTRYNQAVIGPLLLRGESETQCRVRMEIEQRHTNAGDFIHGGTILGFADVSIFSSIYVLRGVDPIGSATVDLTAQFIGAGRIDRPLDAVVELLRETRRMAFLRGTMVQENRTVAAFSATIRKPSS